MKKFIINILVFGLWFSISFPDDSTNLTLSQSKDLLTNLNYFGSCHNLLGYIRDAKSASYYGRDLIIFGGKIDNACGNTRRRFVTLLVE